MKKDSFIQRFLTRIKQATPRRLLQYGLITLLIVFGIISTAYGTLGGETHDWVGLALNLGTEILGGVGLFLLIDIFITKPDDKIKLITQLENEDKNLVKQTINELRRRGWLSDGSLHGYFLQNANFEGISLKHANVKGLGLYKCNLTNTRLEDDALFKMKELRLTTLPDGKLYDGRYCLPGDIDWARKQHNINFMEASSDDLAKYYRVTTEEFIAGQKWAFKNMEKFGREIPPYLKRLADGWITE